MIPPPQILHDGNQKLYYHLHRIRSLSHIIHRVSKNPLTIKCNENKRASKGPDHIREIDRYIDITYFQLQFITPIT